MQPWIAERTIDAQLARAMIGEQFPELGDLPLSPFGEGWDNLAFLVGDWVFRFPRRQVAVALLERECRVLPSLQSLPLPLPDPVKIGRPDPQFPWPFAGYLKLPGHPATGVDDQVRQNAAPLIGRFLRALHATAPPEGVGGDELDRLNIPVKAADARERASQLSLSAPDDALDIPLPSPGRPRVLLHGDLYARHLLVDGGRLSGVIDWGDLHLGDPAIDLAIAWGFLPLDARAAFGEAYGPIDEETWRLARFRAATHALACLSYAGSVGDVVLEREAHRALVNVRSTWAAQS